MPNKENMPKVSINGKDFTEYILCRINTDNIHIRRVLDGDTQFPVEEKNTIKVFEDEEGENLICDEECPKKNVRHEIRTYREDGFAETIIFNVKPEILQ